MEKLKQWVALTVLGVIAIMAAGWFLLVSPKKSEASDLNAQAVSKEAANSQLVTKLTMLKAQAKDLPRQQAALAAVAAKIPDNSAMPGLIRALNKAASDANVELVSLAPGVPTPLTAAPAAVRPAAATPVAVTPLAAAPVSAASGISAGTLNSISVTLSVVGGYFQVEQFLDRLETLQRAFKVSGVTMAPGDNPVKSGGSTGSSAAATGRSLAVTVTGSVYSATGRVINTANVPATSK